jgi:ubiquinone/menaquinone biosynthesis C-methylase UbiE
MNYDELIASVRSTWTTRILLTTVELGIPDVLANGPLSAKDVALNLHCDERAVELLLNAVTGTGLLKKDGKLYSNSEMAAEKLVKTSPEYGGNGLLHYVSLWNSWTGLSEVVKSGEPVNREKERTIDEYHQFVGAMHDYGYGRALAVAETIDMSDVGTLLDLGGGPGSYAIAFSQKNPHLKATVFDRPPALDMARKNLIRYNLTDRITLQPGDFVTDELRGQWDAVWGSHIIHSMDSATNIELIKKPKTIIKTGGKLFIQDFYLNDDKASPANSAVFAINMLVNTKGGRTYTFKEVKGWLTEAGFKGAEVIQSPEGADIISATLS